MANSATDDNKEKSRPQFGDRFLTDPNDVFKHNAWDNVTWDEDQETTAREQVEKNSRVTFSSEEIDDYIANAPSYWNKFYTTHDKNFFKDRHWLFTEFPELLCSSSLKSENLDDIEYPGCKSTTRILEVGCGAGNTIFPILETNNNPNLFVYGCDFSQTAVEIVKKHDDFNSERCHAFVCDISKENLSLPFPKNSLDVIILIFVLSAIDPDRMPNAISNLAGYLKPGGKILFRDYGRYDMAQLRFKAGRCLADNFYVRGDGTKVYFFKQEEVEDLFIQAGLIKEQSLVDRRLQVNRSKLLKMYRVWIQCKFMKPIN